MNGGTMTALSMIDTEQYHEQDNRFVNTKTEFYGLTSAAQEIFSSCWDLDEFLSENKIFQEEYELDKKRIKLFKKHQNQQLEAALSMLESAGYNCFNLTAEDISNLLISDKLHSLMKERYENTGLSKKDLLKDFILVNNFGDSFFDSTLSQRLRNIILL